MFAQQTHVLWIKSNWYQFLAFILLANGLRGVITDLTIEAHTEYDLTMAILGIEHVFLHGVIVLLILSALKMHLDYQDLSISIGIGFILSWYGIIDHHLHQFFLDHGIYASLFPHIEQNDQVNPQYAKILIMMLLIFGTIPFLIRKSSRSLSRIFVFIIACSVFTTTLIFHLVLITGAFSTAQDREDQVMRQIAETSGASFHEFCKNLGFDCNEESIDLPYAGPTNLITKEVQKVIDYAIDNKHENLKYSWHAFTPAISQEPSSYQVTLFKKGDIYRVVASATPFSKLIFLYERLFCYLSIAAHSTWLFGGFLILGFHNRRFKAKAQMTN